MLEWLLRHKWQVALTLCLLAVLLLVAVGAIVAAAIRNLIPLLAPNPSQPL